MKGIDCVNGQPLAHPLRWWAWTHAAYCVAAGSALPETVQPTWPIEDSRNLLECCAAARQSARWPTAQYFTNLGEFSSISATEIKGVFPVLDLSCRQACQRLGSDIDFVFTKSVERMIIKMESFGEQSVAGQQKKKSANTKAELLQAAHEVLIEQGFSGLSTRRVADKVGAPMSQIQYHFGSKESMILALFEDLNKRLLGRQKELFDDRDLTISEQWNKACDFLDEDLNSGYVRILHELMAAGWSNPAIGAAVSMGLDAWTELLTRAAERAERELGTFAPFAPSEIASLVAVAYLGAESQILLGRERESLPVRRALRRIGDVIESLEMVQEKT